MKIKILMTDTDKQLILKPEDDFEKEALKLFEEMPNTYKGDFGISQAGYYRNFSIYDNSGEDLIIRFPKEEDEK